VDAEKRRDLGDAELLPIHLESCEDLEGALNTLNRVAHIATSRPYESVRDESMPSRTVRKG
jgi:hypothetical protein